MSEILSEEDSDDEDFIWEEQSEEEILRMKNEILVQLNLQNVDDKTRADSLLTHAIKLNKALQESKKKLATTERALKDCEEKLAISEREKSKVQSAIYDSWKREHEKDLKIKQRNFFIGIWSKQLNSFDPILKEIDRGLIHIYSKNYQAHVQYYSTQPRLYSDSNQIAGSVKSSPVSISAFKLEMVKDGYFNCHRWTIDDSFKNYVNQRLEDKFINYDFFIQDQSIYLQKIRLAWLKMKEEFKVIDEQNFTQPLYSCWKTHLFEKLNCGIGRKYFYDGKKIQLSAVIPSNPQPPEPSSHQQSSSSTSASTTINPPAEPCVISNGFSDFIRTTILLENEDQEVDPRCIFGVDQVKNPLGVLVSSEDDYLQLLLYADGLYQSIVTPHQIPTKRKTKSSTPTELPASNAPLIPLDQIFLVSCITDLVSITLCITVYEQGERRNYLSYRVYTEKDYIYAQLLTYFLNRNRFMELLCQQQKQQLQQQQNQGIPQQLPTTESLSRTKRDREDDKDDRGNKKQKGGNDFEGGSSNQQQRGEIDCGKEEDDNDGNLLDSLSELSFHSDSEEEEEFVFDPDKKWGGLFDDTERKEEAARRLEQFRNQDKYRGVVNLFNLEEHNRKNP